MKKSHILSALVVAIGVGGAVGMSQVQAQEGITSSNPPIIQKLVERFGLNEAEVKAVFEEEHAARKAEMKTKAEERLTQLVSEGKLTEAQKTAIIAKHAEMEAQRESMKDSFETMTQEERKATMEKHRVELEAWATEQGIDSKYLMFTMKFKGGHGGPGRQMGEMPIIQE